MESCNICGKLLKKAGMKCHVWRKHTDEGELFRQSHPLFKAGHPAPNKGRPMSESQKIKLSVLAKARPGHSVTEETKKKISNSRRAFLLAHPEKMSFRNRAKESYPEKVFREKLIERGITEWVQHYNCSIYEYDFAFIDKKIDIEIDGHTHSQERVKQIDARRDKFSVDNGWVVIRIPAKEVLKDAGLCIDKYIVNILS